MNETFPFLGLVQNAALLLAVAFIFDVISSHWRTEHSSSQQAIVGLAIGAIGISIMMTPWTFMPGVVFDTRSVLIGISGLFFGLLSSAIAIAMTAAFRFYQGGTGTWTGIAVILASGVIGIAWRQFRRRPLKEISWFELYLFGIVIHLAMLGLMLTLPWETALRVLSNITLPVILVYPLGTALLGMLMANRLQREQADETLKESEARYRSLFNNNHAVMLIVDPKSAAIIDANPAAFVYYGWSLEELTKMRIDEINTLTREAVSAEMQLARSEKRNHFFFKHRRADGTIRDVEVYSGPIQIEGRSLLYSIVHDITDRRQAEEEVQANRTRLSNAMEMVHLGHWEYDVVNDLFTFNDEFYNIFRTTVEQVGGYTMHAAEYARRFVHPDDMNVVGEEIRKAIETTDPHFTRQIEHRMLYTDGTVGYIAVRFFIMKDSNGRTVKTYGVNQDITERQQAEEALHESEERYKALFDRSLELVFINDLEGRFIDANNAALDRFGYKREEIRSLNFATLLSEDQIPLALQTMREIIDTGHQKNPIELRLKAKNGDDVLVETVGSVILHRGQPFAIQGIARDITDRKRVEEELRYSHDQLRALAIRLEKAREETRTTISHDLHDDVGGNLAGLKMDLMKLEGIVSKVSDGEQKNALMVVSAQAKELINKTIRSARRIMMELRPSVLDDFGLVAALEWQMGEFKTHTRISCQLIADQQEVNLEKHSATAIFRIFQETLANVARHSGATEVFVRLSSDQDMLFLEVTDNGKGITEEQLSGKASLGLMGMRERSLALGGTIQIRGESGKGTTVTLRVPMGREE